MFYTVHLSVRTARDAAAGHMIRRKLIVTVVTVFVTFVLRAAFASFNAWTASK